MDRSAAVEPRVRIAALLASIEAPGDFAARRWCPAGDLELSVVGVGPIRLPISAETAEKLVGVARPAPFGHRDRTLYDPEVRDGWEIGAEDLEIFDPPWERRLTAELRDLWDDLGLPENGELEAELDKLLIYGPGQHFAPHQDSERDDDMVGTLVVTLPSDHLGGALVVEHRGERRSFATTRRGAQDLSLVAFYADCRHEVREVTAGYRVALTYRLSFVGGPAAGPARAADEVVAAVADLLGRHFDGVVPRRWPGDPTPERRVDRLVLLLDHEYSQRSLGWTRLKNADRARAAALRAAAERRECETFLALVDVHECWNCEDDGGGYEWGRRRRGRHDVEIEEEAEETPGLLDLIDSSVEVSHWLDAEDGEASATSASIDDHEICAVTPTSSLEPYKSEHEGWMGNYGNTVDRWYHRAAVVVWPRARRFELRSRIAPAWGLGLVRERLDGGDPEGARNLAARLAAVWPTSPRAKAATMAFPDVAEVAVALHDADLAAALAKPFEPADLEGDGAPRLVALVDAYGAAWAADLLEGWWRGTGWDGGSWHGVVPEACAALTAAGGAGAVAIAGWIAERLRESLDREWAETPDWVFAPGSERSPDALYERTIALVETAVRGRVPSALDLLVDALLDRPTPLGGLAGLLERVLDRAGGAPAAVALGRLHAHTRTRLEAALASPPRAADDWSLPRPSTCSCDLCAELGAFLADPARTRFDWPLAKDRRQHVHQVLDRARLPVHHETLRRGRPYVLQLRKRSALFEQAAAERARFEEALARLTRHAGVFGS